MAAAVSSQYPARLNLASEEEWRNEISARDKFSNRFHLPFAGKEM